MNILYIEKEGRGSFYNHAIFGNEEEEIAFN